MAKKIIDIIIVVFVLAIIGAGIYLCAPKQNNSSPASDSNAPAGESANAEKDAEKPNAAPAPAASSALSYADALKIYADRRIQFSVNSSNYCAMNPSSGIVFKKGTARLYRWVISFIPPHRNMFILIQDTQFFNKNYHQLITA